MKYSPVKLNDLPLYFYLQWHITNKCNLRCRHCYVREYEESDELSYAEMLDVVDRFCTTIQDWKVGGEIAITGGEPLLSEWVFNLLDYIHGKVEEGYPLLLTLMSNGTTLKNLALSEIRRHREILKSVQLSLDGAERMTHDRIRGTGVYDQVLAATRRLQEARIPVALHFVLVRENHSEAFTFLEKGCELGVKRVTISRYVPVDRFTSMHMLGPVELKETLEGIYQGYKRLRKGNASTVLALSRCDLWHLVDTESAVASVKRKELLGIRNCTLGQRCLCGINGLTIDANGEVYPCRRLPISIGNIRRDSFTNIWMESDLLWKFRNRGAYQKGKCRSCRFLTDPTLSVLCAGGAACISYAVSGDCFAPDPQCWADQADMTDQDTERGSETCL